MPKFSLKSLLTLVSLFRIATYTLNSPSLTAAVVMAISTGSYLISILILGFRKRRIFLVSVACLCGCYLGVADGGMWRISPWNLPAERLLNQHPVSQGYFSDSPIRSDSLLKWAWLTCIEEYRKTNNMASSVEIPTTLPASTISLDNGKTIDLPAMALSTVNAVVIVDSKGTRVRVVERYSPKNKPFFIIGHCWFVIFALGICSSLVGRHPVVREQSNNSRNR